MINFTPFYTDYFDKKPKWVSDFLAFASGIPLVFATEPYGYFPLAIFTPFLLWISLSSASPKRAIWRGWLFGMGLFGFGVYWIFVSLNRYGNMSIAFAIFLTFLLIAFISTFSAFWTWIWSRFLRQSYAFLTFPFWWILMEAFRGWFLTGFNWMFLGTSQLNSPVAGFIPIVGVFGVSAIGVAFSLGLGRLLFPRLTLQEHQVASYINSTQRWNLSAFLVLVIALGLMLDKVEWTKPTGKILDVGMVQPSIPQDEKWTYTNFDELVRKYLVESSKVKGVDLLIWPESALPITLENSYDVLDKVMALQDKKTQLVIGIVSYAGKGDYYNTVLNMPESAIYRKVHLVPFGEFIPFKALLNGALDFFNLPMSSFISGDVNQLPLNLANTNVAPLICYEVTYSDYSSKQASLSNWLLTISNDAWFGDSLGPYQHAQIARYRAAEARLPMVRVTNDGLTFTTDERGNITKRLERFKVAALRSEIQVFEGKTPYTRMGTMPLVTLAFFILFYAFWRSNTGFIFGKKKQKQQEKQKQQNEKNQKDSQIF